MRQIPNIITLFRVFAAPVAAWLLAQARYREALALVILAGLTDWFDGWAARKLKASGKTGIIFDPLADKILLVVLFVELAVIHLIPLWMFLLAIIRDLVIVVGALLVRIFRNVHKFVPSIWGKISTFFQIMLVLMVLLDAAFPHRLLSALRLTALALSGIFITVSGIGYIRRGIEMARQPALPRA
ncbi:MAG TPA: CDP-alcohol phosphatidyltransferase family protein [Bryobacteraceae bacterium]|nr:CDP-alcohol phosphatidyltransferase family protein [Bryobacteraceae bacterium]